MGIVGARIEGAEELEDLFCRYDEVGICVYAGCVCACGTVIGTQSAGFATEDGSDGRHGMVHGRAADTGHVRFVSFYGRPVLFLDTFTIKVLMSDFGTRCAGN